MSPACWQSPAASGSLSFWPRPGSWRRKAGVYRRFRQEVGRAILLGLELLVAADIIRTVAISPTLESVAVLSGIVLVRTLLSFSLEVELTGMWPWQRTPETGGMPSDSRGSEQALRSTRENGL